mgnify:CR=1 FL=1
MGLNTTKIRQTTFLLAVLLLSVLPAKADDWEIREDDPIVQTWQACEENLPDELKDDEWDE